MATDFSKIKPLLDLPSWQPCPVNLTALHIWNTSIAGSTLAFDNRASQYAYPLIWQLNSAATLSQFDTQKNGYVQLASPALTGVFGIGAHCWFAPSHGPRGTIAAGATATTLTLTTALPAAVGINQLVGKRIRIIQNTAGANGTTQERTITANTSGTTPTLTLDSVLTGTPALGAAYELLTGRVYLLSSGTMAAGTFKYYDVATNSYSGNLSVTNLPATINIGTTGVVLDELHTPIKGPWGSDPVGATIDGEVGGYFGTLTATAAAGTTITGHATNGDAAVLLNEYRNFQIRIVEDATTPTAVGQRRRITSHTAGPSAVYTVPTWTVTPSANAKFVIENNNDLIVWTSGVTTSYRYEWLGNTWDTTTYALKPGVHAAGSVAFHPFGQRLHALKNNRYSYIYNFRGGGTNTLDIFDIAGGATGVWNAAQPYDNQGLATFALSAACAYDPVSNKALLSPVSLLGVAVNMYAFDVGKSQLVGYTPCPIVPSTIVDGNRMAISVYVDGTDKKTFFYYLPSTLGYMIRTLMF